MAFMKPEYLTGLWLEVICSDGDVSYVPADLFGRIPDDEALRDFAEIDMESSTSSDEPITLYAVVKGTGTRLSASGYMDATDWFVLADEKHARAYMRDQWEVDPDTGDALGDEDD